MPSTIKENLIVQTIFISSPGFYQFFSSNFCA
nr:MAG TPA: hypothetical protein [Caudoviricetes sp.]